MAKREKDLEYKDLIRHGGKRERLLEISKKCSMCGKEKDRSDLCTHHLLDKFDHRFQVNLCHACHAKLHAKERKPIPEADLKSVFESSINLTEAAKTIGLARGRFREKLKKYGLYKRNCRQCGSEFEPNAKHSFFCSTECAVQAEKDAIKNMNANVDKEKKRESNKRSYNKHRIEWLARQKEYYGRNKEKILEYHKKFYELQKAKKVN